MLPPDSTPCSELPAVLIVDDEEDFLDLARALLDQAGIRNPLVVARSAAAAIEHLQSCCDGGAEIPGLILLDIHMPGVDGFEVLRWVRDKAAVRQTKVAMLTSSVDPQDQKRASELGADAYVVKFPSAVVLGCLVRTAFACETGAGRADPARHGRRQ